jgi:IS4 transposase
MQFVPSTFTSLLKPIDRRAFKAIVERHDGDAYDKKLKSWDHLVALLFAQLSGAASLRAIVTGFNAQSNHHYHLGCAPIARSTLSDANARRPPQVFAELLARLVGALGRQARAEAQGVLRLVDSTPIRLGELFDCVASNGRIRGLKLHVLHAPEDDCPLASAITPANVNDIAFGRGVTLEPGLTYVFDRAYCHYGWWANIDRIGAFFVTRPKTSMRFKTRRLRPLDQVTGDGFTVMGDR